MTYQEKLIRLALAVIAELRRIPDYHDEAARRLRARNGHTSHAPAEAMSAARDDAVTPLPRRRPRVDA
jgi:hypothetical protein